MRSRHEHPASIPSKTARIGITFALIAVVMGAGVQARAAEGASVSLGSLLHEMTDRDALARFPQPGFLVKETTSHDPHKKDPADPAGWHSNADYGNCLRTETNEGRKEWVIAEDTGPGAITRIWTPLGDDKNDQIVRFYLDGASTPVITAKYLDLISGQGFVRPPLAFTSTVQGDLAAQLKPGFHVRGEGGDLYLPIPFAKSFKVTLDSLPFYYSVTYRMYDAGTPVESFSMAGFDQAQTQVQGTSAELLAAAPEAPHDAGADLVSWNGSVEPGAAQTLALRAGSAAVHGIEITLDPKNAAAVRTAVIEASFDGEPTIWCPLSEFFGTGVRFLPIKDFFRTVDSAGHMSASWTMPYRRTGSISLRNLGKEPLAATVKVFTAPWSWDERSMHFHANWHCQFGIPTRPFLDWNYINLTGKGQFVGDTLTDFSSEKAWYGEGDERIYVDGEHFPSHLGTGTEDYYGYAWGMAGHFSSPFMSAPLRDEAKHNKDDWRGYTTDSRLRMLDTIPFQSSLKHDMEIWDWTDTKVDYAVGLFWYGFPGTTDNVPPQPREASTALHDFPPPPYTVPGAIECETMTVVEKSPGLDVQTQDAGLAEGQWSAENQLFVMAKQVGAYIVLSIPAPDEKAHHLVLYGTRSADYGILRFTVNGQPATGEFDGYRNQAAASGPIPLGIFKPKDGKFLLRVEVVGANPAAGGARYFFGLDCVALKPAP